MLVALPSSHLDGQSYILAGSASQASEVCYQLTPDVIWQTGGIFSTTPINLTQSFSLDGTLFFGCKDGNGADGIVFILATTNTLLGVNGEGMGYQGLSPSIAIEMDDFYNNQNGDPTADHMAIMSNGSINHNSSSNLAGPAILPNLEDCEEHCFTVTWNPSTQTLAAALDDDEITYTGNIINSIFGGNTLVYYGFSAATGGYSNIHRVCFGPPELEAMDDLSVCEGESVTLQADEQGIAWAWAPDPTLSAINVSDPIATPDETTTYTVEIEYLCGYYQYDTITVEVQPMPQAVADNNGPLCEGETLVLEASGGIYYSWEGPLGFSSSSSNPSRPNFTEDMAGTYVVTVTDGYGCTAIATTDVEYEMAPEITFAPLPEPLCLNQPPFFLSANPPGGTWEGDVNPNGLFDPGFAGVGTHILSYTVSSPAGCIAMEELEVVVVGIPVILIDPPGLLCEGSEPVQLTASPFGGIWEGEISLNGLFDPGAAGEGQFLITYIVSDGNGCSNSSQIVIEVLAGVTVDILPPGPFCANEQVVQLSVTPGGGTWGGDANADGEIFPSNLGPGFHLVTYFYTDGLDCYSGEVDIEIVDAPQVVITPVDSLCPGDPPVSLTASPAGGSWSGAANNAGEVDPALLGPGAHNAVYTYVSPEGCADRDSLSVFVHPDPPTVANITEDCDSTAASFVVLFSISGGDPSTYTVQGTVPGTITPGTPSIFTSDPIPNGSAYTFLLDDASHCAPVTITGDHECLCATNAGLMNLTAITACEDDTIRVTPPGGLVLDPDDIRVYGLHAGDPANLLMVSDTNVFAFGPPLQAGTTYFISSIAGNGLPGGGVDPADPCLSVSFGTPVTWHAKPIGLFDVITPVCHGETSSITFTLTGDGPFDVTYTAGPDTLYLAGISSPYTVPVTPATSTPYTLYTVELSTVDGCLASPAITVTLEVIPEIAIDVSATICAGESMWAGGNFQTTGGLYMDTLAAATGCDSIVMTTLQILPLDTVFLFDTSCDPANAGVYYATGPDSAGCDSTTVTIVTYAESDTTRRYEATCDPALTGVFTQTLIAQDGCDSLVITTVVLTPSDTLMITGETCEPADTGTFSELLTNQYGCDSLVITTITLLPSDTVTVTGETCDPDDAGMFTVLLVNQYGCDSLVITTITLLPSDTVTVTGETCDPDDAGMFTLLLVNQYGCDSLVLRTVALLPSDTTDLYLATCEEADTGVFDVTYMNIFGCDSLVRTTVALLPYDSCNVPAIPTDVGLPNVFSPNGDGINDRFFISAHPDALDIIPVMRIYDRWGNLVAERSDIRPNQPADGWDGTFKDEPVNPGVYVWIVVLRFADGHEETRTGDVTLLR